MSNLKYIVGFEPEPLRPWPEVPTRVVAYRDVEGETREVLVRIERRGGQTHVVGKPDAVSMVALVNDPASPLELIDGTFGPAYVYGAVVLLSRSSRMGVAVSYTPEP